MNRISCRDALARLYEYLDGELAAGDAEQIQRHLQLCRACYPHLGFLRSYQDALRRAAEGQPPCPSRVREQIANLLRSGPPDPPG